jgi:hypothetical protein
MKSESEAKTFWARDGGSGPGQIAACAIRTFLGCQDISEKMQKPEIQAHFPKISKQSNLH